MMVYITTSASLHPKREPIKLGEKMQSADDCTNNSVLGLNSSYGCKSEDFDIRYKRTLSTILQTENHVVEEQGRPVSGSKSSFVKWEREFLADTCVRAAESQRILKTILFEVPLMHGNRSSESIKECGNKYIPWKPQASRVYMLHSTSQESPGNSTICITDKEQLIEQYIILRSLVPPISDKTDEQSILEGTIEYLKELEARLNELKNSRDHCLEHTSDNCESIRDGKRQRLINMEASEFDEDEMKSALQSDNLEICIEVTAEDHEVLVNMRSPWKESLILDIMEALAKLNLDTYTVQSSTTDGILTLTLSLKSKIRGAAFVSEAMIKQSLRRTISMH